MGTPKWTLNVVGGGLLCLVGCSPKPEGTVPVSISPDSAPLNIATRESPIDTFDVFMDSLSIGRKGLNRLDMVQCRTSDGQFVRLLLFGRSDGSERLLQEIRFEKEGPSGLNAQVVDFNNDGFNDLTCISATAARGANEVRRLWIYVPEADSLVYMKNSMNYPNLLYNERLDCIDAFLVCGGCSTVFLKIAGDSLKETARVELFEGLTVTRIDRNGKERVILKDTSNHAGYIRYKNYDPLEVYDDY